MTLMLELPVAIEQYLQQQAEAQSLSIEDYTLQILIKGIEPQEKSSQLADFLQSWIDEDEDEQKETGDFLIQAIDADRLSDRAIFPEHLKGVTW